MHSSAHAESAADAGGAQAGSSPSSEGSEMSVALSRVAAFLPAGAPAIRWCPPQVRAMLRTRDVRVPSNVVEVLTAVGLILTHDVWCGTRM
eukprot:scaffold1105_cov140-Isochrysis_galbana.AAC.16